MKKVCFILGILLLFSASLMAQKDSSFMLMRTYTGDISDATIDNLDNLYIVSSTGQVKKFGPSGDSLAVYNQVRNFGKLFSLDVTNPLMPLLFYKDFSTIVLLDRFLTNRGTIDLRKVNILQPIAAGIAYDNNIWVFDEYDNKLKKIDEQGQKLMETADFRTIFSETLLPQKIINDNKQVYLADTANGVFVFDNYGSFRKKIPVKHWQSVAVTNSQLVTTDLETIAVYNPATMQEARRKQPAFQPYFHSFTNTNKFVRFSPAKLEVYQIRF